MAEQIVPSSSTSTNGSIYFFAEVVFTMQTRDSGREDAVSCVKQQSSLTRIDGHGRGRRRQIAGELLVSAAVSKLSDRKRAAIDSDRRLVKYSIVDRRGPCTTSPCASSGQSTSLPTLTSPAPVLIYSAHPSPQTLFPPPTSFAFPSPSLQIV